MKKTTFITIQLFLFFSLTHAAVINPIKNLIKKSENIQFETVLKFGRLDGTSLVFLNVIPEFNLGESYCQGETAQVLPTISENGITGTWVPSAIDTSFSANYTFTPDAGQMADTYVLNVIINPLLTPTFQPFEPIYLGGVVPVLPNVSLEGIFGIWLPSIIDNTETAEYTFIPDASECATIFSLIVTVIPIASPAANSPQTLSSGSTLADIMITPSNVIWYDTYDDAQANVNSLPLNLPLVSNRTYYAVNDNGQYRSLPFPVMVMLPLNNNAFDLRKLIYYPNPVSSILTISSHFEINRVEFHNLLGQLIKTVKTIDNSIDIDLSDFPNAVYTVSVESNAKNDKFKIVKQ